MGILAILSCIESILGNDLVVDAIYALLNDMHLAYGPEKIKTMFEAVKEMIEGGIDAAHATENIVADYNAAYRHAAVLTSMALGPKKAAPAPATPAAS